MQRPKPGFATIKTTQAIVTEEQSQREQQDYFEFQNLKRQHAKLLKAVSQSASILCFFHIEINTILFN